MRRNHILIWVAGTGAALVSGQSVPVRPLGGAATGAIVAGSDVRYSIVAQGPSVLRLATDVFQAPLVVRLRDSTGRVLKEVAPVPDLFGAFELAAGFEQPGTYVVEVAAPAGEHSSGIYELRVAESAPAGAQNQARIRASDRLNRALDGASEMSQALSEADHACDGIDDTQCSAQASFVKGLLYDREHRYKEAKAAFETAAKTAAAARDPYGEGAAASRLASTLSTLGDARSGLEITLQATAAAERAGSAFLTARTHLDRCVMMSQAGQMAPAAEECRTADRLAQASGLTSLAAEANVNLAEFMAARGDPGAEELAASAMEVFRADHDRKGEAFALHTLADLRQRKGDLQGALQFATRAGPLYDELRDPWGQASNLRLLGSIYSLLGQVPLGESHFRKAAEISRSIDDRDGEAQGLLALGMMKFRRQDVGGALADYRRALDISRELSRRPLEAKVLELIGSAQSRQDKSAAASSYRQALAIYREVNAITEEGHILGTLGGLARGQEDYATALEYYRQALEVKQKAGDRFQIAISKLTIGATLRSLGKFEEARSSLLDALHDVEALRAEVMSPNLRMTFFDQMAPFYNNYIDLLMEMHGKQPDRGYEREAFRTSESARARVLLDNLPALRDVIPPELAPREKELREQIEAARKKQPRSAEADVLQGKYEQLYRGVQSSKPWYAVGQDEGIVGPEEVARRLLDDRTALVEFKVCDSRTYVWVVTRKDVYAAVAAGRKDVRKLVVDLLAAQKLATIDGDEKYWQAAEALSRQLIAPIAAKLTAERILIVADDVLQQVPFAGLPWPEAGGKRAPLVERFEIVNIPSASTAVAARAMAKPSRPFSREIAVFADPVSSADDGRINGSKSMQGAAAQGQASRARLFMSAKNLEPILRILPPNKVSVFTGFQVSVETLKSARLQDYRVLYFATHTTLDPERPETSGIDLSTFDEKGAPRPGTLGMLDIYQLLIRPDLVVLSNCSSAEGANRAGEGLVTFARAFLFAGARRVIATLWDVQDIAAERLTRPMLTHLVGAQRMNPAAALRQSQLSLWRSGLSPRHWAAYIVIGDWE